MMLEKSDSVGTALMSLANSQLGNFRVWVSSKSAATVLAHYQHLEAIPKNPADWAVKPRGAEKLSGNRAQYEVDMADALAFIKPTFNEDMRGGHTNM